MPSATEQTGTVLAEEPLGDDLWYVERTSAPRDGVPRRHCELHVGAAAGQSADAVSALDLLSFDLRVGGLSLPVEGYGDVSTNPDHRHRGYMRVLMQRSLRSARDRVALAALFGISDFYPRYGFTTCLSNAELRVATRQLSRLPSSERQLRPQQPGDLPGMVALYNRVHALRPWTVARPPDWDRLPKWRAWAAGVDAAVLERAGEVVAYVVMRGTLQGWREERCRAMELVAEPGAPAAAALAYALHYARERHYELLVVAEPLDSPVGEVARTIGCELVTSYQAAAGGMACILDRARLLEAVGGELERRAAAAGLAPESQHAARAAVAAGALIQDDAQLLRLLFGYERFAANGPAATDQGAHQGTLCAWFPGGGGRVLPTAHAHGLDRY